MPPGKNGDTGTKTGTLSSASERKIRRSSLVLAGAKSEISMTLKGFKGWKLCNAATSNFGSVGEESNTEVLPGNWITECAMRG